MDNENNKLIADSSSLEKKIKAIHQENKTVENLKLPLVATSFVIPALQDVKQPERHIVFLDTKNSDKRLLHMMIIAAYNYAFLDDTAPLSGKGIISQSVYKFVDWLNFVQTYNRYNILKEYESYRFDQLNNHGGYSALNSLRTILFYALERSSELRLALEPEQLQYLQVLKETRISPNLNKKQDSLASYFGGLDWLRRTDLGIGNDLYQTLASPKLTINSFKITVSTIIIELYKCKLALKQFLIENDFVKYSYDIKQFKNETKFFRATYVGECIYFLCRKYHEVENKSVYLHRALTLMLFSNVTNENHYFKILPILESKEKMEETFRPKRRNGKEISTDFTSKVFIRSGSGALFSLDYLMNLTNSGYGMSVTKLETLMFSWLMANLTVQPTDIPKLTRSSFRFLKVGGKVTHIECEYFKSRVGAIHHTRSLSTRKLEGKALYLFLKQHIDEKLEAFKGGSPVISTGYSSISGVLFRMLSTSFLNERIIITHRQQGHTPPSFPIVMKALIRNGLHTENVVLAVKNTPLEERKKLVAESDTPCPTAFFGLQSIKNSSVHAYSDPYTLDYLINKNSHSNQTEKKHYLNEDNEEWINASGRITRSVMMDLINNVFDLRFTYLDEDKFDVDKAKFNNEFSSLADSLSYKSGEMISRLKVVTGQKKGKVNEIGVLSFSTQGDSQKFEPIYVLDSSVTVFKILNYRYEFSKSYKKLLSKNPNFLFMTAMPTIEWMEHVLDKLSKSSLDQGQRIFNQMRESNVSISVFHSI